MKPSNAGLDPRRWQQLKAERDDLPLFQSSEPAPKRQRRRIVVEIDVVRAEDVRSGRARGRRLEHDSL